MTLLRGEQCDEFKSYLVLEVLLCDLHRVVLNSVPTPLVRRLLGHQLFEDEEQQLVVVPAEGQISSEGLPVQKKRKKKEKKEIELAMDQSAGGK